MTPLIILLLVPLPGDDAPGLPTSLFLHEPPGIEWSPDPQGARSAAAPSKRAELNVFAGAVIFDGDFDADPFASLGAMLRVPAPFLPTGRFAVFGEAFITQLERDADPMYDDTEGVVLGGGFGVDFQIHRNEAWYLLAQAGGVYITFGDVIETDDGFGGLLGLLAGFQTDRRDSRYAITINPQWCFDGDNWILLINAGFNVRF